MSISSISQQAPPQLTAQQALAAAAVSDDFVADDSVQSGAATPANAGNAILTGSTGGALSSQTLQALLDLTQNDPADQQSTQQSTDNGQVHHRHHHHSGGGLPQQPVSPTNDPTASIAELDSSAANSATSTDSDDADSLAAALGI